MRQLKTAPDTLRVDCFALHARGASTSELLKVIRENPAELVDDPKREIRTFRLILGAPMGTKRGQGRGSFVTSVLDLLDGFYEDVIQGIKPWAAAPPKLRPNAAEPPEPTVAAALVSTSLSSQDGAEPADISTNTEPEPLPGGEPARDPADDPIATGTAALSPQPAIDS